MQGQVTGNRNLERKARSLSRFKMGDTDGNIKKDTASPKLKETRLPEAGRQH